MKKRIKIHDLIIEYTIITRNVKYWRLEIKDENLVIVMPQNCNMYEKFIKKHEKWIYKKFMEINKKKNESQNIKLELNRDISKFTNLIKELVHKFSLKLNVEVNRIYFKKMKSRWGSCSAKKNISINVYLNYLPQRLIEYVVFHEIAHLLELNHSKKFWSIISSNFPDYKNLENELSIYWFAIKDQKLDAKK